MIWSFAELHHSMRKLGNPIKLLVAIITMMCCLCGCGQNPKIDVTASVENGNLVFKVPHSDINGLLDFVVTDDARKHLWDISMGYEEGEKITYRELPTGGNMPAKQLVPYDGVSPPPVIWVRPVSVTVRYQYDQFMAASVGDFSKTVQIPAKPKNHNP